jgi:hypothetical protein
MTSFAEGDESLLKELIVCFGASSVSVHLHGDIQAAIGPWD